jgi:hypothetical protein
MNNEEEEMRVERRWLGGSSWERRLARCFIGVTPRVPRGAGHPRRSCPRQDTQHSSRGAGYGCQGGGLDRQQRWLGTGRARTCHLRSGAQLGLRWGKQAHESCALGL